MTNQYAIENADAALLATLRARELPCLVFQIVLVQEWLDPGNGVDLAEHSYNCHTCITCRNNMALELTTLKGVAEPYFKTRFRSKGCPSPIQR